MCETVEALAPFGAFGWTVVSFGIDLGGRIPGFSSWMNWHLLPYGQVPFSR